MILFCYILFAFLMPSDGKFQEANRLYDEQRYSEALMMYEKVLTEYPRSAALHYNAGNTCFRMRLYGHAILHYRQALAIAPWDDDTRNNLKLTELSLSKPVPIMAPLSLRKSLHDILGFFPFTLLSLFLLFFWYAFMILTIVRWMRPEFQEKLLYPLILAGILFLFFVGVIAGNRMMIKDYKEAVILKPQIAARSEPVSNGATVFDIYEGWRAEVTEEAAEWIKIRMDSGKEGWIKRDDAGIVLHD